MDPNDELSRSSQSEQDDRTDSGLSGSSLSNDHNPGKPVVDEEHDALMKKIVRRENRAVMCLRLVVIFVLLAAGAVAATAIYLSTSHLEQKAFDDEFESVSINILRAFKNDLQLKFFMAQTVSATVIGAMEQSGGDKTNTTVAQFRRIVHAQSFLERVRAIYWSPYLKTTEEKDQFEQFANESASFGPDSPFPVCFFCGSPDMEFVNKDKLVEGFGQPFTCRVAEAASQNGIIRPETCEEARELIVTACGCKLKEGNQDNFTETDRTIADGLFVMDGLAALDDQSEPPYHPMWQVMGATEVAKSTMYNQYSEERRAKALDFLVKSKLPVISETFVPDDEPFYRAYGRASPKPTSILFYPISAVGGSEGEIIGSVGYEFDWELFFVSVPPPGSEYVDLVIQNTCGQTYTYQLQTQPEALERSKLTLIANVDVHDRTYNHMGRYRTYEDYDIDRSYAAGKPDYEEHPEDACRYSFAVYPTYEMESRHVTNMPLILAVGAGAIIAFACFMFLVYDRLVTVRQRKVMRTARRTNAIVSSLFPENVRTRLFDSASGRQTKDGKGLSFPDNSLGAEDYSSDPIADLFPAATVIFMDISGFTAWASEREPTQVFKLLESVYNQFDGVASSRGVFKVETVGDSYVAAVGLPDPRPDHAVVMAKFAFVCMKKFHTIVRRLEVQLGPSTGELKLRCGIHSGPVTAGVLRGEKARFQLFGTTMNTASRMESTGVPGKIQISEDTAKLLREADKEQWLVTRPDKVEAKGLGTLTTYFIEHKRYGRERRPSITDSIGYADISTGQSEEGSGQEDVPDDHDEGVFWETQVTKRSLGRSEMAKNTRLVDWNTELLGNLLTNILAHRKAKGGPLFGVKGKGQEQAPPEAASMVAHQSSKNASKLVIDQVADIIPMPQFDPELAGKLGRSRQAVILDTKVRDELREFVFRVASLYRDNPFHNFDHASHVTMSASKLLRRIVSPSVAPDAESLPNLEKLHRDTYGISSDPIMQFTVVLATIIHDLDHTGLSNQELVHLQTPAALNYDNRSVAEQNSLDIAWALLTDTSEFQNLRRAIYTTPEECGRFRQILVNAVIATDIADKDLQKRRKERWARAFSPDEEHDPSRKATIVMDYILQASDIAHTMQHFLTYRKWNARLFEERYRAWKIGREPDPRPGWYKGEIGFFDFYIIPVAMRLKECGVFGVSHDEYLNYANANRMEWEKRGEEIVKNLIEKEETKYRLKEERKAGVDI